MGVMFFFRRSDVFLNIVSHVSELEAYAKVMAVCPYRSTLAIICELLPRLLPCDDLEPRLAINRLTRIRHYLVYPRQWTSSCLSTCAKCQIRFSTRYLVKIGASIALRVWAIR
jgi:hypothetical protein